MKKMILAIFTLVVSMSFITTSEAMANEMILDYATKTHLIGGKSVKLSNSDVLRVERFLLQNEVNDNEAKEIISKLDQIKVILNTENVSDLTKLSDTKKKEVLALATSAAEVIGAKITYNNTDKTLVIYDKNGKKFDTIAMNSYLKQTGNSNVIYYVSAATLLLGAVVIRKSRNA